MNPTTTESLKGTIETIDRIIEARLKQVETLREMKAAFELAIRAGVHPDQIAKCGYDPSKDPRWKRWPASWTFDMKPETNYVILKDGTRVDFEIDWRTRLDADKARRREIAKKHGYL